MKAYIEHLPTFFLMVVLGIVTNLLYQKRKNKIKFTTTRILEEIFSSLWISIVVAGCLDYFTDWSTLLISCASSVGGFFHSRLIDSIGNDILVTVTKTIVNFIKNKAPKDEHQDISE